MMHLTGGDNAFRCLHNAFHHPCNAFPLQRQRVPSPAQRIPGAETTCSVTRATHSRCRGNALRNRRERFIPTESMRAPPSKPHFSQKMALDPTAFNGFGLWCAEHQTLNISTASALGYASDVKISINGIEYISPIHYILFCGFMRAKAVEYAKLAAQATSHHQLAQLVNQFKQRRLESCDCSRLHSLQTVDQVREFYSMLLDKYNLRHFKQGKPIECAIKALLMHNDFPPLHSINFAMHDRIDPLHLNSSSNCLATCCSMLKDDASPWTKMLKRVANSPAMRKKEQTPPPTLVRADAMQPTPPPSMAAPPQIPAVLQPDAEGEFYDWLT